MIRYPGICYRHSTQSVICTVISTQLCLKFETLLIRSTPAHSPSRNWRLHFASVHLDCISGSQRLVVRSSHASGDSRSPIGIRLKNVSDSFEKSAVLTAAIVRLGNPSLYQVSLPLITPSTRYCTPCHSRYTDLLAFIITGSSQSTLITCGTRI
jgi:hypothetical protein